MISRWIASRFMKPSTKRPSANSSPVSLTFIPYYAWANREQSAMEVWVPLK